jgi:hypothetical protein
MYAASESNPGVRFFEYPLQAIEEQLDEMKEQRNAYFQPACSQNSKIFIVLAIFQYLTFYFLPRINHRLINRTFSTNIINNVYQ